MKQLFVKIAYIMFIKKKKKSNNFQKRPPKLFTAYFLLGPASKKFKKLQNGIRAYIYIYIHICKFCYRQY